MTSRFRTLRLRLTLIYVLVFGLTQMGLWMAADLLRTRSLAHSIDRILQDRGVLLIFVLSSLLIAALASWLLAGRILAPLRRVAAEARALSASDLSARIHVPSQHDEVHDMVVVVNGMLDRLQTQLANQQRFIADVSHELKTPLAVLLGEVQALRRSPDPAAACGAFADTVEAETRRLLRIVESFLILARARTGNRPAVVTPVPIEELVVGALHKCAREARQRGVRLVPQLHAGDGNAAPIVAGDSDLLAAMLENLVRNAVGHSPERQTVTVGVTLGAAGDVAVAVRDYGPPIPDNQLAGVFDLFRQSRPGAPPAEGAGVDLTIAKGVAELHRGSIEVENCPDGGCVFRVRLPLAGPYA